jgi:hypothetical protein
MYDRENQHIEMIREIPEPIHPRALSFANCSKISSSLDAEVLKNRGEWDQATEAAARGCRSRRTIQ